MILKAEKSTMLEEGEHRGFIEFLKHETRGGFSYTDINIETSDGGKIRFGVPTKLQKGSAMGDLYERLMGSPLIVGVEYDIDELFTGIPVVFYVVKEKGKDGKTYPRVMNDTVRRANA